MVQNLDESLWVWPRGVGIGLFNDTWSQYGHSVSRMTRLFLGFHITRLDTRPHIKWTVILVIVHGHFNLPQGFGWICLQGYVWVNTLTLSPQRIESLWFWVWQHLKNLNYSHTISLLICLGSADSSSKNDTTHISVYQAKSRWITSYYSFLFESKQIILLFTCYFIPWLGSVDFTTRTTFAIGKFCKISLKGSLQAPQARHIPHTYLLVHTCSNLNHPLLLQHIYHQYCLLYLPYRALITSYILQSLGVKYVSYQ